MYTSIFMDLHLEERKWKETGRPDDTVEVEVSAHWQGHLALPTDRRGGTTGSRLTGHRGLRLPRGPTGVEGSQRTDRTEQTNDASRIRSVRLSHLRTWERLLRRGPGQVSLTNQVCRGGGYGGQE